MNFAILRCCIPVPNCMRTMGLRTIPQETHSSAPFLQDLRQMLSALIEFIPMGAAFGVLFAMGGWVTQIVARKRFTSLVVLPRPPRACLG